MLKKRIKKINLNLKQAKKVKQFYSKQYNFKKMSVKLVYSKVRDVKSPVRGTSSSAGIDFFVPVLSPEFQNLIKEKNPRIAFWNTPDARSIVLHPHERVLIPSGIHVNLFSIGKKISETLEKAGIALIAHNKSGVGSKLGLDRLAEVVDEDYQGELHISLVNTGGYPMKIHAGEKLIQFVLVPVMYGGTQELPLDKLYSDTSMRGIGGFGSTDAKK